MIIASLKSSASRLTRAALGGALGVGLAFSLIAAPASAADEPPAGPALWAVTDADSTIYLFGTVHVLRPETVWRTPRIETALAESSAVWIEATDVDDQAVMGPLVQQYGMSTTPLSSRLTPEENARLAEAGAALGMPAAGFEPMQPWLASVMVSVSAMVQAGYDPESGVDPLIEAAAVEAGKPVHGLESAAFQIQLFSGLPEALQLEMLRQAFTEYREAPVELDALVSAWAAGDDETIGRIMAEEMQAEFPDLYEVLLVRRNASWADQIETMLEGEGVTFIAVGAGHLAGEDSVQAMLAARGVEVARR